MGDSTLTDLRRWLTRSGRPLHPDGEAPADDQAGHAPITREVEFSAYTEDCRVFGFTQLGAERLSDALNEHDELRVDSVLLLALDDNRAIEMRELVLKRDELIAVRASGPRGNAARRRRTRPSPVVIQAGPYLIRGYLHPTPGGDPLQQFRRRPPMVPLTEAWIEYEAAGTPSRARVGPIIVNRHFVDWVERATDTDIRVDLPVEMRIDPRAKDLTGNLRSPQGQLRVSEAQSDAE